MSEAPESPVFENLLKSTGWGLYYKFMIGLTCASAFIHGCLLITLIFAVSIFACEFPFTEKNMVGIYINFLVGRYFIGGSLNILCDRYGRKKYLCYSLIVCFMTCFVLAFSYNFYMMFFGSLLLGAGVEMLYCTSKILLAEILPQNSRGFYISFCDIFYYIGYLSMSAFAIFSCNPAMTGTPPIELKLTTWRIMFAVCGGISILVGCSCALLEESPRYFLHVQKNYLAYLVLKQFYAINKSSYAENFDIKEGDVNNLIPKYNLPVPEHDHIFLGKFIVQSIVYSIGAIMSRPFYKTLLLLILIKTPLLILSVLGLNFILPKYMLNANNSLNETQGNLTYYTGVDFVYPGPPSKRFCESSLENRDLFVTYLILASSLVGGPIISMLTIDYFGRKVTTFTGFLMSSAGFLSFTWLPSFTLKLVHSSILLMSVSWITSAISVINIESFPTALRGTAYGLSNLIGTVAAIFFTYYIFTDFETFGIALAIAYICAAVATLFLPELKKQPMVE